MKRLVLLLVALLLVSGAAFAQPPTGYIFLFNDETHVCWCADGIGFYPAEVWVFCLPSMRGQICAEFMVCNPANVIGSTITWNTPLISVTLGDPDVGLSVCYVACQWDWHWIYHRLYYVTDPTQTYISICPHPDIGVYQFANCEPGYPVEPCIVFNHFYLNENEPWMCCMNATQEKSWGAIKSMIGE